MAETLPSPPLARIPSATPVVLLVDDQPIFAKTVAHMLGAGARGKDASGAKDREIEFHSITRGLDGPAKAAELNPTVILQDLSMPDADGLELITAYRAQEATRHTPLIVLSADEDAHTKAEAFRRGANDYLVKPCDRVELVARIRYHSRAYRLMMREQAMHQAEKERLIAQQQAAALRSRETLIFGLAKLAESRDTDTGEHLERIAAYCRILAEELRASHPEMDDDWVLNLQLASSLHDIGKVGVPDAVLLKPGRLTPEERLVIETHPRIGADALDAILARDREGAEDPLLRMARNIAAAHHERWDGAGYPGRLAGAAIPLEARIVAVADVYDALTSKRIYKPALSHDQAAAEILKGRGAHFDPAVVDAFSKAGIVFREVRDLLQSHAGKPAGGSSAAPPA